MVKKTEGIVPKDFKYIKKEKLNQHKTNRSNSLDRKKNKDLNTRIKNEDLKGNYGLLIVQRKGNKVRLNQEFEE